MNKIIFNILFAFLFCQGSVSFAAERGVNAEYIYCAPQLQNSLKKIQQIPEGRELLASIQKEGPIQIIVKNTKLSNFFGAFWDPNRRQVCIALTSRTTEGSVIGSLLFELHNASVNAQFDSLADLAIERKIDRETYVRSMEYLEYQNSLNAAKIAEKGIQMGLFPADARLPTFSSFNEHYSVQKRSGHSDCFARIYDHLCQSNRHAG